MYTLSSTDLNCASKHKENNDLALELHVLAYSAST